MWLQALQAILNLFRKLQVVCNYEINSQREPDGPRITSFCQKEGKNEKKRRGGTHSGPLELISLLIIMQCLPENPWKECRSQAQVVVPSDFFEGSRTSELRARRGS